MSKFKVGDRVRFVREVPITTAAGPIEKGHEGVVVGLGVYVLVDFPHKKNAPLLGSEIELIESPFDSLVDQYRLLHIQLGQIQEREAALTKERHEINDKIAKLGDQILATARGSK